MRRRGAPGGGPRWGCASRARRRARRRPSSRRWRRRGAVRRAARPARSRSGRARSSRRDGEESAASRWSVPARARRSAGRQETPEHDETQRRRAPLREPVDEQRASRAALCTSSRRSAHDSPATRRGALEAPRGIVTPPSHRTRRVKQPCPFDGCPQPRDEELGRDSLLSSSSTQTGTAPHARLARLRGRTCRIRPRPRRGRSARRRTAPSDGDGERGTTGADSRRRSP